MKLHLIFAVVGIFMCSGAHASSCLANSATVAGCTIWSYTSGATVSPPNPALSPNTCPTISGPPTGCFQILYCKDSSGISDTCKRRDFSFTGAVANTGEAPAQCISGYNIVAQSGKDNCVKKPNIRVNPAVINAVKSSATNVTR